MGPPNHAGPHRSWASTTPGGLRRPRRVGVVPASGRGGDELVEAADIALKQRLRLKRNCFVQCFSRQLILAAAFINLREEIMTPGVFWIFFQAGLKLLHGKISIAHTELDHGKRGARLEESWICRQTFN